jgi:hypothetical protein
MGVIVTAILTVVGVLLTIFVAVVSRLVADDLKAWSPRLVDWLIRKAVARLPEDQRERMDEEWRSHIDGTPGELWKLVEGVGFLRAARVLAPVTAPDQFLVRLFLVFVRFNVPVFLFISGAFGGLAGNWLDEATHAFGNPWSLILTLVGMCITSIAVYRSLALAFKRAVYAIIVAVAVGYFASHFRTGHQIKLNTVPPPE